MTNSEETASITALILGWLRREGVASAEDHASLAPLAGPQELHLRSQEMEKLGLEPGSDVRVRSSRGELVLAAVADGGVPSGVALLQFNATPIEETSASALIDSSAQAVEVLVETIT